MWNAQKGSAGLFQINLTVGNKTKWGEKTFIVHTESNRVLCYFLMEQRSCFSFFLFFYQAGRNHSIPGWSPHSHTKWRNLIVCPRWEHLLISLGKHHWELRQREKFLFLRGGTRKWTHWKVPSAFSDFRSCFFFFFSFRPSYWVQLWKTGKTGLVIKFILYSVILYRIL